MTIRIPLLALLAGLAFAASAQTSVPPSPQGRWITASGNLEVEIAPCGTALCGTVTKVLAHHSMSREGDEMKPADDRPALGMQLLTGFTQQPGDGPALWEGQIYNRENGKTYRCRMSMGEHGELVLRPYVGLPLFGKTQLWQRQSVPPAQPRS